MSLNRRLARLEEQATKPGWEEAHERAMSRALSAVSDDDLELLERIAERGSAETEEELAASSRFIELYDRELNGGH